MNTGIIGHENHWRKLKLPAEFWVENRRIYPICIIKNEPKPNWKYRDELPGINKNMSPSQAKTRIKINLFRITICVREKTYSKSIGINKGFVNVRSRGCSMTADKIFSAPMSE
jgi:hypothetical protein